MNIYRAALLISSLWIFPVMGSAATYQSMDEFLSQNDQGDAYSVFYDNTVKLRQQFDYICPDTFCEGEYTNLASMNFDCSVEVGSKKVVACSWHFYGSNSSVNPDTGIIDFVAESYSCKFAPNIDIESFMTFMTKAANLPNGRGYEGLRDVPLPGQTTTLWDVLVDCL